MHDLAAIAEAITELRRRGDTIVRLNDLRLVAAAANHGRRHRPGGDTDYTSIGDAVLERIESAIGDTS